MMATQTLRFEQTATSRLPETDFKNLPFGKVFTDHMFLADFKGGRWTDLRIVPYGPITISPGSPALHYGQSIFEGMKAYRGVNGETLVFRMADHARRLGISAHRMSLAEVPEGLFTDALQELLTIERKWIPADPSGSLYIRPFIFSAEEYIGIRPSDQFTFMIILCPVGAYYSKPLRVKIETYYTRAVAGGTGFAKAGGNYGGAIYPTTLAVGEGYDQLLWTDGKTHTTIEESGTMNVFFVKEGRLITPELSDSILSGITRDSLLKLARYLGLECEERKVEVREIIQGIQDGVVTEAFGAGTAATLSPIECIGYDGGNYFLNQKTSLAAMLKEELESIKHGRKSDPFGWVTTM